MSFLNNIFSSKKERFTSLRESSDNFNQLSIQEMDSILGGKPLIYPTDEQKNKAKLPISKL